VEKSVRDRRIFRRPGWRPLDRDGTLAGLTRARGTAPGVVWIDAHSDINSPATSRRGTFTACRFCSRLENGFADVARTVQIGLRDVDEIEKKNLRESGVKAFSMTDVGQARHALVMEEALRIAGAGGEAIHVSSTWTASIRARRPVRHALREIGAD